jgi:DNA-binding Lrp family transcriptional regulator
MRAVFILLKVEPGYVRQVADHLVDLDVCSEIHSVVGDFDLLIKVHVDTFDDLADLVNDRIHHIPHLRETRSILTFKTYKDPRPTTKTNT